MSTTGSAPGSPVLDALGRVPIAAGLKARIDAEFAALPADRRGALLVIADEHGGRAHLAAHIGEKWRVAGGLGTPWTERRPTGYVSVELAW